MYRLIVPLLLLFALNVSAEYEKIDSLNYSIIEGTPDSTISQIYSQIAQLYLYINLDSSLIYSQMAYDVALKNDLKKHKLNARGSIGQAYYEKGDLDNGLEAFIEAWEISQILEDSIEMGVISNWIGLFYWKKKENEKAIKYFQESYLLSKQTNDEGNLLYILNNLGLISMENERYDEAFEYFEEVLIISEKQNDDLGIALAYANIGTIYHALDSFDLAIKNLGIAQEFFTKAQNLSAVSQIYADIARALKGQGKYVESIKSAEKGLKMSRKENIYDVELMCLEVLAESLILDNKNQLAIKRAKEGIALAGERGLSNSRIEFYKILADASENLKNYKSAFLWQKRYIEKKDSVFTQEKQNEISQLEIEFQSKQKDIENEQLKNEKDNQALIIQQQTRMSFAYSAILVLLGILLFLVYRAKKKTKFINKLLSKKVKERTDELEAMNVELIQTNEELKRFAFISSHDLKEPLRNVGGFITLIKKRLEEKKYDNLLEYIDFVEKGNYQLDKLVDSIRVYFKKGFFSSENMELINLNESMNFTLAIMSDEIKGRNAKVVFDPLPNVYYNPFIINIIFQKLIENGIKYNQSDIPVIRIYHQLFENELKITIADNGLGIAPEYQDKIFDLFVRLHNRHKYSGSGMGLAFCKKLLDKNGGSIKVHSQVGKGSQFIITLPANIVYADTNPALLNAVEKEPNLSNLN